MIRCLFAATAVALGLGASAADAAAPPSARLLAAELSADSAARVTLAAPLVPPLPAGPLPRTHALRRYGGAALARVAAANRAAVHEPELNSYLGAVQLYPWAEGALYRLYTGPGEVSDVALQPGETLVSVAAGDTARWVIGDTTSGSGATRRTHVLVKPSGSGLRTNLVIATDRRVYHVLVDSEAASAMAGISWSYPEDPLLALRGSAVAETSVATGIAVDALNFNYRIEGDNVPWLPVRVFDDGRQVFIEFPASLATGEAPPLFVTGERGQAELVNYRLRGHYYVVDRLFAAAELRLGGKHQQVVRIVRAGGRRSHDRSGS